MTRPHGEAAPFDSHAPQRAGLKLMQTILLVIYLMVVVALIGVVLIQRSEGGGLGSAAARASCLRVARPMR